MTPHRFKSSFGQCECLWCGRQRFNPDCGVTLAMRHALYDFAKANGRTWKSKLRQLWESGGSISAELQQCRNVMGSRILAKLTARTLDSVNAKAKR